MHRLPFAAILTLALAGTLFSGAARPSAAQRSGGEASLALPATDDSLPGSGPVRRADWFDRLWLSRRTAFAAEAAALFEGDSAAAETVKSEPVNRRVVFFGDSITQSWGDDFGGAFTSITPLNRGISGDTTRGMLSRIEGDVLACRPGAAVLLMGTNDLAMGATPETVAGNVRTIFARLREADAEMPVVLCLVMPSDETKDRPPELIQKLNALLSEAAAGQPGVTLLDTYTLFAGPDGRATADLFPDLLHPNAAGYAVWQSAVEPTLQSLGVMPIPDEPFTPEPGFRSLLNGRDLTGWQFRPLTGRMKQGRERLLKMENPWANWPDVPAVASFDGETATPDDRFVVRGDRVVALPVPEGRRIQQLWTSEEFAEDFELRLQFRAGPNADSGVFIRYPQLQVRDYPRAGPYRKLTKFRPLEWNDLRVVVTGRTARCECNGEVLEEALELPESGPVGLEGDRGLIEYRRVRVRVGS